MSGTSSSDTDSRTLCQRVQRALIGGSLAGTDREGWDHVRGCSECCFLQDLSRNLEGPSIASVAEGPLSAFVEVCDRAMATGQPIRGRYRLVSRLGFGGQGVVYRAIDAGAQGETVAVKLVRIRESTIEPSAREVALAHRVRHPGICRVYHTEAHGQLRLITMEYIEGGSLDVVKHQLTTRQRMLVFRRICEAIQAAHEAGVLHLDLKPRNILLRSPEEPIVTDFGLAVAIEDSGAAHAAGGTPRYMAPEQARRDRVDPRTDVYALGVLAEDLLPPSRRIRALARRCTAPDPAARFADVGALRRTADGPAWRRAPPLRLAAPALLLVGFFFLPAPLGRRAYWYPEFGRPDVIPPDAWNVALNSSEGALPAVTASRDATGCARSTRDLNDGITHYTQWEHGFAFPGPKAMCVNLDNLGQCGALKEDATLCQMSPSSGGRLRLKVRERARVQVPPGAELGQIEEGDASCDTKQTLTVTLERSRVVFAVRAWYVRRHLPPMRFGVEVEDAEGRWRPVFETTENTEAMYLPFGEPRGLGNNTSIPITTQFPPLRAKRVRLTLRCNLMDPAQPSAPGGPVWLYELEVFGRLSRGEAWWRYLAGAR